MKNVFVYLLLLISPFIFSQEVNKKTHYFYGSERITKNEFDSFGENYFYFKKTENDSSIINVAYERVRVGKLDSIQVQQIKTYLHKLSGSEPSKEKKILIHLYRNDKQIYKDSRNNKYLNYMKNEVHGEFLFFFIGTKDSKVKENNKRHIYLDSSNLFENLFFKKSEFEMNHILILPNGDIKIYLGIDDISGALDLSL